MTCCTKCNKVHSTFKNGRKRKTCDKVTQGSTGSGFLDILKARPKSVKDLLSKYGNNTVEYVRVAREPIASMFSYIINKITSKPHDQLFHLFVYLHLNNGMVIRLEKNQRVAVKVNASKDESQQHDITPLTGVYRVMTLNSIFDRYETLKGESAYVYDAVNSNCQDFILSIVHILGITKYDAFIKQNVKSLVPKWAQTLSKIITDTASVIDYTIKGGGKGKNKLNCK